MKKQSKFKKLLYSQKVAPYVFVMPFIITFVVFFAYSIVSMIIMSFQKVAGPNTTFVGLENYKILTNAVFIKSLKNSIFYTIVTCLLMIPIPMVLAAMLNSKHMRAKGTFRSILFIPALTSVVVAGVVFRLMFGELDGSFMNQVVGLFGIKPIVWLRTPATVWCTMFFLCLWRWTGVNMMYYLSGLQQIVQSFGKSLDKFPAVGKLGCFDDFSICSFRFSNGDIVADSSVFDPCFLKHHTIAASQRMAGNVSDLFAVYGNGSGIYIIESHQKIDKG